MPPQPVLVLKDLSLVCPLPAHWRFMTPVEQAARPGALLELIDLVWRPLAAHVPNSRGVVRVELEAQIGRLGEGVRR